MTIGRIIAGKDAKVLTCQVDTLVSEAIALLGANRIGALPVIENGSVVGIFSERDVIYKLREHGPAALQMPVKDVMTTPAITVAPETSALAALSLITKRRIRHLPVLQGSTMIGFVSIGDIVKYRIDQVEAEAEAMRDYIRTV